MMIMMVMMTIMRMMMVLTIMMIIIPLYIFREIEIDIRKNIEIVDHMNTSCLRVGIAFICSV